jgi:hypothetical protein
MKEFKCGDLLRFTARLRVDNGQEKRYYCIVMDNFGPFGNVYWIIAGEPKQFYQAVQWQTLYGTYEKVENGEYHGVSNR